MNMEGPGNPPARTLCHINLARGYRGGERQTELLIRELQRRGWSQRLVARQGEPLAHRLAPLQGLELIACAGGTVACSRAIGRADLVHVHEGRSLRCGWANSVITGTPYVVTRRVQKGPGRHWLNRHMYRRASGVVALSRAIGDSVARLDPSLIVTVIPSAVSGLDHDPSSSSELRAEWGGDFVVGHVGALDDSHKGQRQIVELAKTVASSHPAWRFVLVGSGRDASWLNEEAGRNRRLVLAGQVERVGDYLGAFDAFLFPSRHEGLGSILLDVLDFGVPVVATRVGGIPEIIQDGVNGFLVDVNDIDAMRRALISLAADSALRERFGEAGRRMARQWSPASMADRYEGLYREILDQQGSGVT